MRRSMGIFLDRLVNWLVTLFALERILKLAAVLHFFQRPRPSQPESWPTVTMLQPITRGASNLAAALRARATLDYPAAIQHLLICDAGDSANQELVSAHLSAFPGIQAEVILIEPDNDTASVATKMKKLQSALPQATGEVLCFVD